METHNPYGQIETRFVTKRRLVRTRELPNGFFEELVAWDTWEVEHDLLVATEMEYVIVAK